MSSQHDRQDETFDQSKPAGHCPLTGRYFEPWVCRFVGMDFGKTWPACWSDIDAKNGVRLLQNSKYFSHGAPMRDEQRNLSYGLILK